MRTLNSQRCTPKIEFTGKIWSYNHWVVILSMRLKACDWIIFNHALSSSDSPRTGPTLVPQDHPPPLYWHGGPRTTKSANLSTFLQSWICSAYHHIISISLRSEQQNVIQQSIWLAHTQQFDWLMLWGLFNSSSDIPLVRTFALVNDLYNTGWHYYSAHVQSLPLLVELNHV